MEFSVTTCALIIVLCYVFGVIIKHFINDNENVDNQFIPSILMVIGAIIGAAIYVIDPSYLGVNSVFDAIFVGLISGFASTGANQFLKKYLPTTSDTTNTTTDSKG